MKSEWKMYRLGDLGKIVTGKTPPTRNSSYWNGEIPFVTPKDIQVNKYCCQTERSLTTAGLEIIKNCKLPKGSLCVSCIGSIGYVAMLANDSATNQQINSIIVSKDFNKDFIFYLLRSLKPFFIHYTGSGSVLPILNKATFQQIKVKVPSLPTQCKIASILSSLDDKIENNNAIRKNLEEQALICFCQTFIESASNKASRPIYEFAEFINGSSFRQSELTHEGLPIIKIGELKAGISATTLRYSGDVSKKVPINDGDILFSWSGNPKTSIDVFIWCGGSGVLNQHIFKVKSLFDCPWFTYLLLKYLMPQFVSIASDKQTTGLGHVTAGDLKRLKFPHDLGKMQSFESTIAPIMLGVYNSMLENVKLLSLRDTLLPKLMRGEIDI